MYIPRTEIVELDMSAINDDGFKKLEETNDKLKNWQDFPEFKGKRYITGLEFWSVVGPMIGLPRADRFPWRYTDIDEVYDLGPATETYNE